MEGRILLSSVESVPGCPTGTCRSVAGDVRAAVAAERSVESVYLDNLVELFAPGGIAPETEATLLRRLANGRRREDVVRALLRTPEVAGSQARAAYLGLFGRAPTDAEQAQFAAQVRRGMNLRGIYARIMARPEFERVRGDGTPAGFVDAAYQSLLGRSPTGGESARLVGMLRRGTPRFVVAGAIYNHPEVLERLADDVLIGYSAFGRGPGRARALRILAGPGSPSELAARAYGSAGYFAQVNGYLQLARPRMPLAPALPAAGAANDSAGLPTMPSLDFDTRWVELAPGGPTIDGTNLISAAADGTIWVTGAGGASLSLYRPATATAAASWATFAPGVGPIGSLAALPGGQARLVAESTLYSIDGQGNVTDITGGGAEWTAVSAAADGTQVGAYSGGIFPFGLYALFPGQTGQTPISPAGYTVQSFSAGSASNIWAIAVPDGVSTPVLLRYTGGSPAWEVDPVLPGASPTNVSATADGAVWAWNASTIYQRSPTTGAWGQLDSTIQTPPAGLGAGSASSQFRLASALADDSLRMLSFGVVDQQSNPTQPTDPDQLAAYQAISQALGAVSPLGIRGDYPNALQLPNLQIGYLTLREMARPSNVTQAAWDVMQPQILLELRAVPQVSTLFDLMAQVRRGIESSNNTILPGVLALVEANTTVFDQDDGLDLWIFDGLSAILSGSTAIAPEGTGFILSAFASAFGSVVSELTNTPNPDSNTKLDLQFSQLTNTLSDLYIKADAKNASYEQSILSDWGRLAAVGRAIDDPGNPWIWPAGSAPDIADATKPGFVSMFLRTLVPAKWQVAGYLNFDCYSPGWSEDQCPGFRSAFRNANALYDILDQQLGCDVYNVPVRNFLWMSAVGGGHDIDNPGSVPTQELLDAVLTSLNTDQATFYLGQAAWSLTTDIRDYKAFFQPC